MRYLIIIVLLCSFVSDKSPDACYRSFKEWYTLNHTQLVQTRDTNDLRFEARFIPNEIMICQEILKKEQVSGKEIKALYKTYGAYEEYSFRMESLTSRDLLIEWSEDKADFQNKQFYLIEAVQQDFRLVRDNDTLAPLSCQFENNYGTAPFITLHLTFEKAPKGKTAKRQLIYWDHLFQSNIHVFDFTHLSNLQIPKIK